MSLRTKRNGALRYDVGGYHSRLSRGIPGEQKGREVRREAEACCVNHIRNMVITLYEEREKALAC
eukprot:scaffold3626_cov69-Skeletonema_dohrnii-CCMP3373.AAC.13